MGKKYTAAEYIATRSHTPSPGRSHPAPAPGDGPVGEVLAAFRDDLVVKDMKDNTVEKYLRDVKHFLYFNQGREMNHDAVACFRDYLTDFYEPSSVNSILAALNRFFKYLGREDCCIHAVRIQREMFRRASRDMTLEEYQRLVTQAEKDGNQRLAHMIQTMAGSGIRVGELPSITVESLDQPAVKIHSKGKIREILLPDSLVDKLRAYCQTMGLTSGCIFVTRTGRPVDRRNIWKEMKDLCKRAGVDESKTFPHNLRHLFARCFYEKEKDIVRLADYLGHSNVETTRRYTITSQMEDCKRSLELGLVAGPGANTDQQAPWKNRNQDQEQNRDQKRNQNQERDQKKTREQNPQQKAYIWREGNGTCGIGMTDGKGSQDRAYGVCGHLAAGRSCVQMSLASVKEMVRTELDILIKAGTAGIRQDAFSIFL